MYEFIPVDEIAEFANNPDNNIERGHCDRNTLRTYRHFKFKGITICEGTAISYRNGHRMEELQHFWNEVIYSDLNNKEATQIIDIYSEKNDRKCEYRHHKRKGHLSEEELISFMQPIPQPTEPNFLE